MFDPTAVQKAASVAAEQDEAKDAGLARRRVRPKRREAVAAMDKYGGGEPDAQDYGQPDPVKEEILGRGMKGGPVTEAVFGPKKEFAQQMQINAQKAHAALPQAEDFAQQSVEDILKSLGG